MDYRVFIGYDPRQPVAYQTLAHSIWSRASKPVSITRLQLNQLPMKRRGLTEFTYSRFIVPYLCDYEGYAMFIDSDFLCRGDVVDCFAEAVAHFLAKPWSPVAVVKREGKQAFEQASMMVFNCKECRVLTPAFIDNDKNPLLDLMWASVDHVTPAPENSGPRQLIASYLPKEWNHLVGYDQPNPDAKLVHFTMGIPCWPETKDCEFAEEWKQAAASTVSSVSYQDLMGRSVHDQHVKAGALAGVR